MDSEFEFGVRALAECLLRVAVDDAHQGELSCADVQRAALSFGVDIDTEKGE